MKIFHNEEIYIKNDNFSESIFKENTMFFDIETTGFSPVKAIVYMIGLPAHGPDAVQAAHGVHGLHPVQPLQGVPARRGPGRFPLRGLCLSFPRIIHRLDLVQPVKYICHLSLLRRPGRPESGSVPPGSASRRPRSSSACGPGPG